MPLNTQIVQIVADLFCLALVWVADILTSSLKTFRRGFFCDDSSIRYPYKESTLSSKEFGAIFLCGPVFLIVIVELIRLRFSRCPSANSNRVQPVREPLSLGPIRIPWIVVELFHIIAVFLFGLGCSKLATDVTKHTVGRLRPNFISVCQPDVVDNGTCIVGFYYADFNCLTSDQAAVRDARLSFPSGHASFSAFTMVYLVLYLQARMKWRGTHLARPLLQSVAILSAWYTGLLRVTDNKHHWSDVLAGFLIGGITAIFTAIYVSHLFGANVRQKLSSLPVNCKDSAVTTPMTEADIEGVETSR